MHFDGQLAEFVKKNGAAIGFQKGRNAFVDRAGERPAFVPEERGFGEALRDGSAIDDDEGFPRAWARLMDGLRDDLFARAGFAGDENGQVGGRDFGDLLENAAHTGTLRNERTEFADVRNDDLLGPRRLERDLRFAQTQLASIEEKDFADANTAGKDAVATAEIPHAYAVFRCDKLRVHRADFRVVQNDLALRVATDDDRFGADLEPRCFGRFDPTATDFDPISRQNGGLDHDVTTYGYRLEFVDPPRGLNMSELPAQVG